MILGQLQTPLQLHQRQPVGQIAIDLVGRAEHERRVGRMPAGGLQQVQGPVGVDREIGLGIGGGPVVGGLGGGVDHQLDLPCTAGKGPLYALGVADVELERAKLGGVAFRQRLGGVGGRRTGAEEGGAHVVLQAEHVIAGTHEVADGLGAYEPARACDDRCGHVHILPEARRRGAQPAFQAK